MIEIVRLINGRVKRCVGRMEFPRSFALMAFFVGFLMGIFLENLIFGGGLWKLLAVFVLLWLFRFFHREALPVLSVKFVGAFIFGLIFGALRFYWAVQIPENDVSNYGGKVQLKGCVVEEVDVRNDKVKYTIEVDELKSLAGFSGAELYTGVAGRVLVTGQRYPVFEYGDCLLVTGNLEKPENIEDFDYAGYLSRYGIYSVIYRSEIELIGRGGGGFFYRLFEFKSSFESGLAQVFAEPYASFMSGLILGSRRGISAGLLADFNTTGLSHIVAISGYNITLLIVVVSGLFGFLSRKMKVAASFVFIGVFVVLVGASAAVVRAAVMGIIGLMALWFGRNYFVGVSLFSAAFFMNLWNPKILIYDVGFQLSFLATCGLVHVSPRLEKYFRRIPEYLGIRSSLLMTISAQVLALPIILLNFGRLSIISPLANVFVLPFIPLAMIFGFFAVVLGYVWNFLGLLAGFIGYLVLALIIFLVKLFAAVPLASLEIGWFGWLAGFFYYLIVASWILTMVAAEPIGGRPISR